MVAFLPVAYSRYIASLAAFTLVRPVGMLCESIWCRFSAELKKSHRAGHLDLTPGIQKSGQSRCKSPSYMRAIWGCLLSKAYSRDVPDRQTPTTNRGPRAEFDGMIVNKQPLLVVGDLRGKRCVQVVRSPNNRSVPKATDGHGVEE